LQQQQQQQQPDIDLLLLDLLTADDKALPEPLPPVSGVAMLVKETPASPGSTAAASQPQLPQAELLQQHQQQQAPQHHHPDYQQAGSQALSRAPPQQGQEQQQEPGAHVASAGSSNSSSSADSSEDFLGDMLHDMAEVLEVDEGALGVHTLPAAAAAVVAAAVHDMQPVPDSAGGLPARTSGLRAAASNGIQQQQQQQQQQWQQHGLPGSAGLNGTLNTSGSDAVMWQQPLFIAGAACGGELPPHEVALQQAWAQEEALVHGDLTDTPPPSPTAADQPDLERELDPKHHQQQQQQQRKKRRRLAPLPRLQALLSDSLADWNPAGRPDASGTAMIGGSVLLCLESLAGLFAVGASAAGAAAQGVDWAPVLSAALAPHGQLQVSKLLCALVLQWGQ
jgi:hypothetical protein